MVVGYGLKIIQMKMEQPLALHCQLQINISIQFSKLVLFTSFIKVNYVKNITALIPEWSLK